MQEPNQTRKWEGDNDDRHATFAEDEAELTGIPFPSLCQPKSPKLPSHFALSSILKDSSVYSLLSVAAPSLRHGARHREPPKPSLRQSRPSPPDSFPAIPTSRRSRGQTIHMRSYKSLFARKSALRLQVW